MAMRTTRTAVDEPVEEGWTQARIRELPAVITAAPSLGEARVLLLDALREYLPSLGGASESSAASGSRMEEPIELVLGA